MSNVNKPFVTIIRGKEVLKRTNLRNFFEISEAIILGAAHFTI